MKNTRLHPRYGTDDSHDFDPQLDFAMVGIFASITHVRYLTIIAQISCVFRVLLINVNFRLIWISS